MLCLERQRPITLSLFCACIEAGRVEVLEAYTDFGPFKRLRHAHLAKHCDPNNSARPPAKREERPALRVT